MTATAPPAWMEPQWFFPLFAVMWFAITSLLAHWGGWVTLAEHFRSDGTRDGRRFRFASGSVGRSWMRVSYGGCLFVTITSTGLQLSLFLPFRFQSPPLFVPWTAVASVVQKRILLSRVTTLVLHDTWPRINLRGAPAKAVYEACTAARPELLASAVTAGPLSG
jgi:hypothetical protein